MRSESTEGAPPADMTMSVIAPGHAETTTTEPAAIETAGLADGGRRAGLRVDRSRRRARPAGHHVHPQAGDLLPQAVGRQREHERPGLAALLRGPRRIRPPHGERQRLHPRRGARASCAASTPTTRSPCGWSDVGYNYLVDKFGRIWEGRAGGVDRPVVGAHTLGYNDYAFAMSAIGNFETVGPSGRDAAGLRQPLRLEAVAARRRRLLDAADRSDPTTSRRSTATATPVPPPAPAATSTPSSPVIRQYAAKAQRGWSGRELKSDLAGTAHPDLIVRRASDGQAFIVPTGGLLGFEQAGDPDRRLGRRRHGGRLARPDRRRARRPRRPLDRRQRRRSGPASATAASAHPIKSSAAFAGRDLLTAVGDLDEDGHNDLVARNPATDVLNAYLGDGTGGFTRRALAGDWRGYNKLAATGDLDGDGHVDLLARDADGRLWLHPGTGTGNLGGRVQLAGQWGGYDTISGFGDFTRDGKPDLVVRRAGGNGLHPPLARRRDVRPQDRADHRG